MAQLNARIAIVLGHLLVAACSEPTLNIWGPADAGMYGGSGGSSGSAGVGAGGAGARGGISGGSSGVGGTTGGASGAGSSGEGGSGALGGAGGNGGSGAAGGTSGSAGMGATGGSAGTSGSGGMDAAAGAAGSEDSGAGASAGAGGRSGSGGMGGGSSDASGAGGNGGFVDSGGPGDGETGGNGGGPTLCTDSGTSSDAGGNPDGASTTVVCVTVYDDDKVTYEGPSPLTYACDACRSSTYPAGPNACRNTSDCNMLASGRVRELVRNCALACRGEEPPTGSCAQETACNVQCVKMSTETQIGAPGLSDECGKCHSHLTLCWIEFCLNECAVDAESVECLKCEFANGCRLQYQRCTGLDPSN